MNELIKSPAHLGLINQGVPLKELNWFKTGGAARFFAQPKNAYEFAQAVQFAQTNKLEIFLLGEGANILISDEGFDGLVIKPDLKAIHAHGSDDQAEQTHCCGSHAPAPSNLHIPLKTNEVLVTAQAGVTIPQLITWCLDHSIVGLEEFSGIPGTVGGAVYINLHYFEFLLEQFLVSAQVIEKETGIIHEVDRTWFEFGYNQSKLHEGKHYLVEATFRLTTVDPVTCAYARGRSVEIMRHRARRYPTKNTCGSFFRNFYEDEVTLEDHGKKMIYVAYYLDKIGVKGALHIGGAAVSYQHANMLINAGNATTADLIALARTMQERVFEQFGIVPQPECRLIGFSTYPLKK